MKINFDFILNGYKCPAHAIFNRKCEVEDVWFNGGEVNVTALLKACLDHDPGMTVKDLIKEVRYQAVYH